MDPCITPLPKVTDIRSISGGALERWPKMLNTAPPRIRNGVTRGATVNTFNKDNQIWIKEFHTTEVFSNLLVQQQVWVMNVVPFDAQNNTLGIVYERGLIGTYMNCKFSLHAISTMMLTIGCLLVLFPVTKRSYFRKLSGLQKASKYLMEVSFFLNFCWVLL
ncbi:putative methyltransferase PMT16 [Vitis vinifera]|uniref:Methyltransferase n=1 Tax=Vitis vinifera TaxID=29760 RepID=A0A438FIX6_VITVI|nr:putative methyltransferase PMT16 [Vitis vinifera]